MSREDDRIGVDRVEGEAPENLLESGHISIFYGISIKSLIFEYFKELFGEDQIDPNAYISHIKALSFEQIETLKQEIAQKIVESISSGKMKSVLPSPTTDKKVSDYNIGETKLEQKALADGTFEFNPIGKFTGVLRVQRVNDYGKLIPNSIDIIEYIDGKPVLVIPGTIGKTRIAGFGNIENQAEISLKDRPREEQKDMPIPAKPSFTAPIFPTVMERQNLTRTPPTVAAPTSVSIKPSVVKRKSSDLDDDEPAAKRSNTETFQSADIIPGTLKSDLEAPKPIIEKVSNPKFEDETDYSGIEDLFKDPSQTPTPKHEVADVLQNDATPNPSIEPQYHDEEENDGERYELAPEHLEKEVVAVVPQEAEAVEDAALAAQEAARLKREAEASRIEAIRKKQKVEEEKSRVYNKKKEKAVLAKNADRVAQEEEARIKEANENKKSKEEDARRQQDATAKRQKEKDKKLKEAEKADRRQKEASASLDQPIATTIIAEAINNDARPKQKLPGPPPRKVELDLPLTSGEVVAPKHIQTLEIKAIVSEKVNLKQEQKVDLSDDKTVIKEDKSNDDIETVVHGPVIQNEIGGRISPPVVDGAGSIQGWGANVSYTQDQEDPVYTQNYPEESEEDLYREIDALDPERLEDIRDTGIVRYGTNEVDTSDAETVIHTKEESDVDNIPVSQIEVASQQKDTKKSEVKTNYTGIKELFRESKPIKEIEDNGVKELFEEPVSTKESIVLKSVSEMQKEESRARRKLELVMKGRDDIKESIELFISMPGGKIGPSAIKTLQDWDEKVKIAETALNEVLQKHEEASVSLDQTKVAPIIAADIKARTEPAQRVFKPLPGPPLRKVIEQSIPPVPQMMIQLPEQEEELRAENMTIPEPNTLKANKVDNRQTPEDMGWQFQEGSVGEGESDEEDNGSKLEHDELGIQEGGREEIGEVQSEVKQPIQEAPIQEREYIQEEVVEDDEPYHVGPKILSDEEEAQLAFELSMKLRGERIVMVRELNERQDKLELLYNEWLAKSAKKDFSEDTHTQFNHALEDLRAKYDAYNKFYDEHSKQLSDAERLAKTKELERLPDFSGEGFVGGLDAFEKKSKILGIQDELRAFEAKPDPKSIISIEEKYSLYIKEDKNTQAEINKVTKFDSVSFKSSIAAQKDKLQSRIREEEIVGLEEKVKESLLEFAGKEGNNLDEAKKSYKDALAVLEDAVGSDDKYNDTIKEYNAVYEQAQNDHASREKHKEFTAVQDKLVKGDKELIRLVQEWLKVISEGHPAESRLEEYGNILKKIEGDFELYKKLKGDFQDETTFDDFDDDAFSKKLEEYNKVPSLIELTKNERRGVKRKGFEEEVVTSDAKRLHVGSVRVTTNPSKKIRGFP